MWSEIVGVTCLYLVSIITTYIVLVASTAIMPHLYSLLLIKSFTQVCFIPVVNLLLVVVIFIVTVYEMWDKFINHISYPMRYNREQYLNGIQNK